MRGEQCFLSWWMKRKFNKFMLPWSRGHGKNNFKLLASCIQNTCKVRV